MPCPPFKATADAWRVGRPRAFEPVGEDRTEKPQLGQTARGVRDVAFDLPGLEMEIARSRKVENLSFGAAIKACQARAGPILEGADVERRRSEGLRFPAR